MIPSTPSPSINTFPGLGPTRPSDVPALASRPELPRILYVDDDADHLELFGFQTRHEFDVVLAGSGQEALDLLEQQGPFAAVVSDMRMPRLDGTELLRRVRERDPNVARLLMTGDADLDSAMRAVNEAQAFRYLTKPCPRERLLDALRASVDHCDRERERDGLTRKLNLVDVTPAQRDARHAEVWLGMVVAGRYRLDRVLGVGGTAVVFACRDRVLQCEVALKLYRVPTDGVAEERIRQELVLSRELQHPNILRAYDIGVHGDCPFITMELLRGKDLADTISCEDHMIATALDWIAQASRGLQYAHALGIVHRDVKPENLFLGDDGTLRLMDFGLARKPSMRRLTPPGLIAGTLHYMSPEQIQDATAVDLRTDVYALGVVAYELLTGEVPFDHEDPRVLIQRQLQESPRAPSSVDPELPEGLDGILLTALAKDPNDRFQSCVAFSRALSDWRDSLGGRPPCPRSPAHE
ncbi:MAG: protein kinase [Myxococcales bacterium]|nr:protein kinase [Myxococcales bacterium]